MALIKIANVIAIPITNLSSVWVYAAIIRRTGIRFAAIALLDVVEYVPTTFGTNAVFPPPLLSSLVSRPESEREVVCHPDTKPKAY